jgi:hypothetical protein
MKRDRGSMPFRELPAAARSPRGPANGARLLLSVGGVKSDMQMYFAHDFSLNLAFNDTVALIRAYGGRRMARHQYKFIFCFLFILPSISNSLACDNGDRPGGDYTSFSIPRNQPADLCDTACQRDPRCVAWTLDIRGSNETPMRCWLKNSAPPLQATQLVYSGLKAALEVNVDRPGSDFNRFDLDFPDPFACQVKCDVWLPSVDLRQSRCSRA